MKKSLLRAVIATALLGASATSQAALMNYTEEFDAAGVHYTLNFQADDTVSSVVTTFSGTAGTDPLTLSAPGSLWSNNNVFDPAFLPGFGGWFITGAIAFLNTTSGITFALYDDGMAGLRLSNQNYTVDENVANLTYSSSPVVAATPIPGAVWLFGTGIAGLVGAGKRKKAKALEAVAV